MVYVKRAGVNNFPNDKFFACPILKSRLFLAAFLLVAYNPEFDGCPLISQLGAAARKDFLHHLIFTVMVGSLRGEFSLDFHKFA